MNFGRKLVVSFQLITLALEGKYYVRSSRVKRQLKNRVTIRLKFYLYKVCDYYIYFMLLFILL